MTGFLEADIAAVANEDVIEDLDAEEFTCLNEATCENEIFNAGCRVATGMAMAQDQRRSVGQHRGLEHLARLCYGRTYVALPLEHQRRASLLGDGRNITRPLFGVSANTVGTSQ